MVPRSTFYKSVYDKFDVDQQENIKSVIYLKFSWLFVDWQSQWGAFGGREWYANASPESLELQKVAGRNTWDTLTEQEQQEIRNAGANWWPNAPMQQRAHRLTITENEKWRSTLLAQLEGAAKGVQYIYFK